MKSYGAVFLIVTVGLAVGGCCLSRTMQVNGKGSHGADGVAYWGSVRAAMESPHMCVGEGYEEGKDRAENADEYLPSGEHPLDDERLDDWDGDLICCEWGDDYPGCDEPGAAYRESQAAAEDSDCHNDS